ncbi:MAG: hypothetical protein ACOC0R_05740 [Mariniphaga sp.]
MHVDKIYLETHRGLLIADDTTKAVQITDTASGETVPGEWREAPVSRNRKMGKDVSVFEVKLKPHSFKAFIY